MDNSQDVKSKLETKYLQITQKNINNIDSWIKEAIDLQSTFFKKNSGFDEIYFSMLDNYNYYSKNRIQDFLKCKLSYFDNYIFTYLKKEDARAESSSIIVPLLYEITENGRADVYNGLTETLLKDLIRFIGDHRAWAELLEECGSPNLELDKLANEIRLTANSKNIRKYKSLNRIIIFEDFVGTGTSLVSKFLNKPEIIEYINSLKAFGIKITFLFLEISVQGEDKLQEYINQNGFTDTIDYFVPQDSTGFIGYQGDFKNLTKKLKIRDEEYSLNALVSSYLETPNNTIALFWKSNNRDWEPLFPRTNWSLLEREDDLKELEDLLEKCDFRCSKGIELSTIKTNRKINLKILVLLKHLNNVKYAQATSIVAKILNSSSGLIHQILNALKNAGYIELDGEFSNVQLTRFGRSAIAGVSQLPKLNDFIDENALI
jgi:hypothetical protein